MLSTDLYPPVLKGERKVFQGILSVYSAGRSNIRAGSKAVSLFPGKAGKTVGETRSSGKRRVIIK